MKTRSFLAWLRRVLSLADRDGPARASWPAELLSAVGLGKASALRELLKTHLANGASFPVTELFARAEKAAWTVVELQKLHAYVEFFSGDSAAGYRRVMANHLAETDFDLFMTTAVHCYLFDRYEEGYELLKQFRPDEAVSLDLLQFLAFAGYITFAAGKNIIDAIAYFDKALDQGLHSPLLAVNAYPIYFEAGRHDRVRQLREIIQRHYADDPEAIFAVACVELCRDYYPEGFRLAESRYQMPEVGRSINPTLLGKRRWHGEDIRSKTVLVHGEQGYGDVVMMARYLPMLQEAGAKVIIDCREAAVSLLEFNYPRCEVVVGDQRTALPVQFDYWTGVMSLPYHFSTTAESVPMTAGYLEAPPEQRAYWQKRVSDLAPGDGARIGLAWSGNPSHRADKRRSVAFSIVEQHLRAWAQTQFFALQISVPSQRPSNLADLSEEMVTLADTAALIAHMDLVITVDTSIVHIAGAMGKPTWLLLPKRYEWRWGLEGETNNWYDSVSILRQRTHGDWAQLLEDVFCRRLPAWLSGKGKSQ